jgi:acetylornithine deacetylase
MNISAHPYTKRRALELLKALIECPSFSKEESKTAEILLSFLNQNGIKAERIGNNVWAKNKYFDSSKPTVLLNSHHDTVKPNAGYTKNPFEALEEEGKLYGLGSNDAGGALVALWAVFSTLYEFEDLSYNLIFLASAEEEISGNGGVEMVLNHLPKIDLGIVGEPTKMQMATSEKGLMVIDATVYGISGHAARNEGENAIYKAVEDIRKLKEFRFEKISDSLGPIHLNVTMIQSGTQHNVVPEKCTYVIDLRLTDSYTMKETLAILQNQVIAELKPRSMRLHPSTITNDHVIVKRGLALGLNTYSSPTMSDQALMPFDTLKIGPGDSARSHTADEFIYIEEIEAGIDLYLKLLENLELQKKGQKAPFIIK